MSIPLFEINIVLSFNQSEKMPLSILLFHVLFFQFIFRGASKMFKKNYNASSTKTLFLLAASSRQTVELRAKRG